MIDADFPIYTVGLSYNYLDQSIAEINEIQSRYALEHIKHQMIFSVDHKIIGKIKNSFNLRFIDRVEQEPYMIIDDRLYYDHNEKFSVFLEIVNLTDQIYTEVMTQMPGRWFRGGVNLDVGF